MTSTRAGTLRLSLKAPIDLLATAREALRRQIAAVEDGRARVRVPRLVGQMRVIRGMHFHPMPELFVQLSGRTTFQFPDERFRVVGDEVCVVPRGMPHGETVGPFRGPFFNLVFMFDKHSVGFHLAYEGQPGRPRTREALRFEHPRATRLVEYLDDAAEAYHAKGPGNEKALKGVLLANFSSLLMMIERQSAPQKEEPFKVAQARQLVVTHLNDPELSVKRLAEWLRCTPDYLSFLFHKETGVRLVKHITEQRLAQARQFLEASTLNIKEIAVAAGFADPGYFARVFRRATGQTPKEYRKALPRKA